MLKCYMLNLNMQAMIQTMINIFFIKIMIYYIYRINNVKTWYQTNIYKRIWSKTNKYDQVQELPARGILLERQAAANMFYCKIWYLIYTVIVLKVFIYLHPYQLNHIEIVKWVYQKMHWRCSTKLLILKFAINRRHST